MLPLCMSGGIKAIEPVVARLQQAHLTLKYAQVPVVVAVAGLALGGGCELMMHASRRVVALKSYIGLVEVGIGFLPAGGGLKEIALRAAQTAQGNDILQFLKHRYLHAATGSVATSAFEARRMGYLCDDDVIILNGYELLHVAKSQALAMAEAGYRPPLPIPVTGRYGTATIMGQLLKMRDGGFISAHGYKIGTMITEIVCGGDIESDSTVNAMAARPRTQRLYDGAV